MAKPMRKPSDRPLEPSRREMFHLLAGLGIGSTTFQRAVAAQAEEKKALTPEMIHQAEWISGIELTEKQRKDILRNIRRMLASFQQIREVELDNSVPMALSFVPEAEGDGQADLLDQPLAAQAQRADRDESIGIDRDATRPGSDDELAFLSVAELGGLLQKKQVSSVELTKLYLARLKKYDSKLYCVVSLLEESALKRATEADKERAAGIECGPLHGIPWGAKDLIAYPGTKTTWGAAPYKDQVIDTKATVAERLDQAGTVLLAKLTLGALAMGDRWFGGRTRNPWDPEQGSSGSSAGSASATVAGLVGFTLGTETLGSIVSPCTRCGATGLRPTFGRVSRFGCMALAWSMDKVGPIARSVHDCALIFQAIHGPDGKDPSVVRRPFANPAGVDLQQTRVGYFETGTPDDERDDLRVLKELGVQLVKLELPNDLPTGSLLTILTAESAAAFDELTRNGMPEGLNRWPSTFRTGEFIPAVEYIRANRVRTLLMRQMAEMIKKVDCYVAGDDLLITNLTGHPTVVMPNGFRKSGRREVPNAITFTGRLFGETTLLAVADAYQRATGFHQRRPPLDQILRPPMPNDDPS